MIEEAFAAYDDACSSDNVDVMAACAPQLDCFNNGGQWFDGVGCALGRCWTDDNLCGADAGDCTFIDNGDGNNANECMVFPSNCHDNPLDVTMVLMEPPSRAESAMCRAANKSKSTIFDAMVCSP